MCVSIAERPGSLGATIFNNAFERLSLDYIYKPLLVESKNLKVSILAIRAWGIRGCGVSMPHKVEVIKYLDRLDSTAKKIGAVNTIVNSDGILTGYNTDFEGAKIITKRDFDVKGADVLIAGAGGAARAIVQALIENKASKIYLTNRDEQKARKVAKEFKIHFVPWKDKDLMSGNMLINATPLGMSPEDACIFADETISRFDAVMDVVVSLHDTLLIKKAKKLGKITLPGMRMASLQGMVQFKLYTRKNIPIRIIEEGIQQFLNKH
ncbi:MAG: Shikimate dehydrogenase [Microgenomates group bacterium GW2011_GWC1_44_37]|uniref:shikimate dehydrogenase (NADP(+)) n=1 Tax=Candidatus Collierbacteria bacterium GW2011_GWB2_44_22 TaxID=1618387 RepID=A0A0G1K882_9BACT|nr:MAG: Shikimate dehydrogenase [Candidatus Collierbacteria bacterium GW2011_GWA2_44_13]KKT51480.1 MAG: Shikimate dehydrogenase [Candidatus Collierbacteria bacterium GW2011_GWB1_44_197]KKT52492.1 MAG: Shikimate dehydrogenase [Candidatus Collierbacteria bacterium GW2011_GWB2_44_22]KKT62715.1 MAG: Shikimate dehydrogenase [Candidatus Collierbacteria bacterium GW2011_GWD1_44_27]KKT66493.1 MAG: Shikimate dehydrogenase [Candidatus Collierbacteria bacterium GW2011_GWC2_44_30]KKT69195.1 MAG: Shikimate